MKKLKFRKIHASVTGKKVITVKMSWDEAEHLVQAWKGHERMDLNKECFIRSVECPINGLFKKIERGLKK